MAAQQDMQAEPIAYYVPSNDVSEACNAEVNQVCVVEESLQDGQVMVSLGDGTSGPVPSDELAILKREEREAQLAKRQGEPLVALHEGLPITRPDGDADPLVALAQAYKLEIPEDKGQLIAQILDYEFGKFGQPMNSPVINE